MPPRSPPDAFYAFRWGRRERALFGGFGHTTWGACLEKHLGAGASLWYVPGIQCPLASVRDGASRQRPIIQIVIVAPPLARVSLVRSTCTVAAEIVRAAGAARGVDPCSFDPCAASVAFFDIRRSLSSADGPRFADGAFLSRGSKKRNKPSAGPRLSTVA